MSDLDGELIGGSSEKRHCHCKCGTTAYQVITGSVTGVPAAVSPKNVVVNAVAYIGGSISAQKIEAMLEDVTVYVSKTAECGAVTGERTMPLSPETWTVHVTAADIATAPQSTTFHSTVGGERGYDS